MTEGLLIGRWVLGAAAWACLAYPDPVEHGSPCLPLDCAGVSVAAAPGFDLPDPNEFVPDRRPAVAIGLYGGSCLNPPTGGPTWWLDEHDADGNGAADSVDGLVLRLDEAYADGWRRIIIFLPAGSIGGYLMSSSQWWPMPKVKRDSLKQRLTPWINGHPDATVGIYVGFEINDPCSLCMQACGVCVDCGEGGGCAMCPDCEDAALARIPRTTNLADMCVVYNNLEPWLRIGVHEIWFDHSGGRVPGQWIAMLELAGNPDYQGRVRFGSEPVVSAGPGAGADVPLEEAVVRLPYVSLRRYYEWVGRDAPPGSWDFDPATTEILAMFTSNDFCIDAEPNDADDCTDCPQWCGGAADAVLIDVVYDYVQRGYIPWAQWSRSEEFVRRIYDINPQDLPCPADLDADGDVDVQDAIRVALNIGMQTGATLYHGDLDFDDDVDAVDYGLLVTDPAYSSGTCAGR